MAVPGITYRIVGGDPLTHEQMNNNFRSLFYSSSITDNGDTLLLHYDTITNSDYHEIPLNSGTGGLSIIGNVDNRLVTATGTALQGEGNLTFDGSLLTLAGTFSIDDGDDNLIIGPGAGGSVTTGENTIIGKLSGTNLTGFYNTTLGFESLDNAVASSNTVALGHDSLGILASGNNNVAIGKGAGNKLTSGQGNTFLGYNAGPSTNTAESNKLYINNAASDTPLVLGDFSTGHVTINSTVSASVFSGSFVGDGSQLTGLTAAAEWDGSLNGDAEITGSLIVSGTAVTVDFTNVESISGSIFSGSFVGDGSLLTGVQAETFPYTGSAIISGSLYVENTTTLSGSATINGPLVVNGTSDLNGKVTADTNIEIHNKSTTSIGIGFCTHNASGTASCSVAVGYLAGYNSSTFRHTAIGARAGQNIGPESIAIGAHTLFNNTGGYNTAIGTCAMSLYSSSGGNNTGVGYCSIASITTGNANVGLGNYTLSKTTTGLYNVGIGYQALQNVTYTNASNGNYNTAIGACAGKNLSLGQYNVYIGYKAGPSTINTTESHRLYIASGSGTPLIKGNFSTSQVEFAGGVSGSFSGSFEGDGSGLTGITPIVFPYNGNAIVTGSLTVTGSSVIVDFTNTSAISGSTFSGSFVGDGSGLTGVTSEWDGSRNGNADITGSLIVSGNLDVAGVTTISSTGFPGGPGIELIHIHSSSLAGTHSLQDFTINTTTGYTGFKAEYSLTNPGESQKKIGTLLGAWDQTGVTTINDSHTIATGDITATSFSIDSDGSTATLKLDASSGTYEVNMLITAFKRQV